MVMPWAQIAALPGAALPRKLGRLTPDGCVCSPVQSPGQAVQLNEPHQQPSQAVQGDLNTFKATGQMNWCSLAPRARHSRASNVSCMPGRAQMTTGGAHL